MDWLIDHLFSGDASQLPQEVSFTFAVIIIFGLVSIFLLFILSCFKYYWETMRPIAQAEKRQAELDALDRKGDKQDETGKNELFQMILDTHNRIGEMATDYAGKYATKSEFKELRDKLDRALEDLSKVKGRVGL